MSDIWRSKSEINCQIFGENDQKLKFRVGHMNYALITKESDGIQIIEKSS